MALDKATQQLLHKVKSFRHLAGTDEWQLARKELFDTLANVIDIRNVKGANVELQVEVRKEVFRILNDWILTVEGIAQMEIEQPVDKPYIHRQES